MPQDKLSLRLRQAKLTATEASCLSLCYFDGLSQDQIAERLDMSPKAVIANLAKAQAKLDRAGLPKAQHANAERPRTIRVPAARLDCLGPKIRCKL